VVDAELVEDTSATIGPAATPPPGLEPDYTDAGVPSFDYVKDRIENRFTTATGATEVVGLGTGQEPPPVRADRAMTCDSPVIVCHP
jgi:hypothetical protein